MGEKSSWATVARGMFASTAGGHGMLCADLQALREALPTEAGAPCRRLWEALASATSGDDWPQAPSWKPPSLGGATALGNPEAKTPRWRLNHQKEIFPVGI